MLDNAIIKLKNKRTEQLAITSTHDEKRYVVEERMTKKEADLIIWQPEIGKTFGFQNFETLSFLTKSTLLIPSGIQILLSYYSSNSFDNE